MALEWVSLARLARDSVILASKIPANVTGIVGIPRSGMMPAAIIAELLHVPLLELSGDTAIRHTQTTSSRGPILVRNVKGPLVIVDDTVYGGAAMARARQLFKGYKPLFAAVYCHPQRVNDIDFFTRELPSPHLLEWNFPNHGPYWGLSHPEVEAFFGAGVASDLDGIIFHDAESGGKLGELYLAPRAFPVPLIVTGRPERHREITEQQLRDRGVKWTRLEMLPDSEEHSATNAAFFKARCFAASGCGMFIESCPWQAHTIHELTKLPVICPIQEKVYQV
jgi:hypoxanthine phosphoribosyltransferase